MLTETKEFYISYHERDRAWAEWIAWQLEEAGYTTTIHAWDFQPGSNITLKMDKALRADVRTIAILSSSYLSAFDTHSAEWATAFSRDPTGEKGVLLPVRVSECKPDGLFRSISYIDLVGKDEQSARQALLIGAMNGRHKPDIPPAFPGHAPGSAATKPDFPGMRSTTGAMHRPSPSSTVKLGTTLLTYNFHVRRVNNVTWSPDGTRIASSGGEGAVHIWDPLTGHNLLTYSGHTGQYTERAWLARWSPDGQSIVSSGYGSTVHVWDAQTGKVILLYHDDILAGSVFETYALAWSPDGKRIASACSFKFADQTIHIWNALTGRIVLKYSGHRSIWHIFSVSTIAWSSDGQYIASCGSDKNVKKRRLDPTAINESIQIWDPNTGQHILTCGGDADRINNIVWSPDNRYIASASRNKTVGIWDVGTGENVFTYNGHTKEVLAVAWSPDGSRIASAANDRTVHLWDAFTGQHLFVYRGHTSDEVTSVAWSPDGSRIASAGADKTVQIWQAV